MGMYPKHVSMAFMGDVMCHGNQLAKATVDAESETYDFSYFFEQTKKFAQAADIAVCNLETTLPGSKYAGYPRFRTPDALATAIADAGFDVVATANNHTYDSNLDGIKRTVQVAKAAGLRVIGTRESLEDSASEIIEVDDVKVGLLNYTYETARKEGSRTLNNRAMDEESEKLVNSFGYETLEADLEAIEANVKELRADGADVVVAFFHWGNEYERYANVFQRYVAWRLANMGVDAIVGGHAHVMQEQDSFEVSTPTGSKRVPVFYSLGNYIWGGLPSYERETTNNEIVALLDIQVAEDGAVSVAASHAPLRIGSQDGSPFVFDLEALAVSPERSEIEAAWGFSVDATLEQIEETLSKRTHPVQTEYVFGGIFQLKAGEIASALDFLEQQVGAAEYVSFFSEDSIIASALQNGRVAGNVPGYTGITATTAEGVERVFIVRVVEGVSNAFPVVVDEFNMIRDIYRPANRVIGGKDKEIPLNQSSTEEVVRAWKAMEAAAMADGIGLVFRNGFRTKTSQQGRRSSYAERYGVASASKRYQLPGRSEHQLGLAVDVNEGAVDGVATSKVAAFTWIRSNAWRFGFLARPNKAKLANQAYVHLRFLGDVKLAKYLTLQSLTLSQWLATYEEHEQAIQDTDTDSLVPKVGETKPELVIANAETGAVKNRYTLANVRDLALGAGASFVIPPEFEQVAAQPLAHIMTTASRALACEGLTLLILSKFENSKKQQYAQCAKKGVIVVSHNPIVDSDGTVLPSIQLPTHDDVRYTLIPLANNAKNAVPMPTVALTGSIGKTTTTLFMEAVFSQAYKVFVTGGNRNSYHLIGESIMERYNSDYNFHIQEVGGGSIKMAEYAATMLRPDAFIIGNIMPHHLDLYGTLDNIAYDKASLDRLTKDGGFGVINWDDDILRTYEYQHRVVTIGVTRKDADYVANNVRQDGVWLKMDIFCKADGRSVPIEINIPGLHNAYNALTTFAMAKEWGLSDEVIQAGFRAYQSGTIRQALHEVSGRIIYMDCFNASVDSTYSSLKTLCAMDTKNGGRRIAIVSGENLLGDLAYSVNYDMGVKLADYDVDEYIFVGLPTSEPLNEIDLVGHAYAAYEGACSVIKDRPLHFFDNVSDAARYLASASGKDDIILIKGSFHLALYSIVDLAFGTSFAVYEPYYPGVAVKGADKDCGFTARTYKYLDNGCNLRVCKNSRKAMAIPDTVCGKPVFRLGKLIFANMKRIVEVDFGRSVVNIGAQAFSGCSSLQQIHVPANVKHVEKSAFWGCTALVEAEFEAVQQLDNRVFANCRNLRVCRIPATCLSIGEEVFAGCKNVTIQAPEGSVAHQYAIDNAIPFEAWEPAAE